MTSLQPYFSKIKPAMDTFLRAPTPRNIKQLEHELHNFDWFHMKIYNVQIIAPLVLKLEEMPQENCQEVRQLIVECIRFVTAKTFVTEVKGLSTTVVIVLKQIQDVQQASLRKGVSEELKLSVVRCIAETFKRSNTDVLEEFYTQSAAVVMGKLLVALVELIEKEKYKTLILDSLECLMVCFYVHGQADFNDVVLRSQVADTLFMYLPKTVTVLYKISQSDEKMGDNIKTISIQALGRILWLMYEETKGCLVRPELNSQDFRNLLENTKRQQGVEDMETDSLFAPKKPDENFEERMKRLQVNGRSAEWFSASSKKMRIIFQKTCLLRSHHSPQLRLEYAKMCYHLLWNCPHNLRENAVYMVESVVAMAEDEDSAVRRLCEERLLSLQRSAQQVSLFDETAETLFDEHLAKLPRHILRGDDAEQYAELLFFKGLIRNVSQPKLLLLFALPQNVEMFGLCLLSALDLRISQDLLSEDYALRSVNPTDMAEFQRKPWRQYKNLGSPRCVALVEGICSLLGDSAGLNRILFDYVAGMSPDNPASMNSSLLLMTLMSSGPAATAHRRETLVQLLYAEVLKPHHWHLALHADSTWRRKGQKPINWSVDRTPGLYESAVEVATYECDSDDDDEDTADVVTMADAEFNVLHTCLSLDALAHCARFYGLDFDRYLFQCIHLVLVKVASSNTYVHQAALAALVAMQSALKFAQMSHFIETYTDYISYHLNTILRRSPDSKDAVDILTVVLQFSSRKALPHLDSIFHTIREECSKSYQVANVNSYLRVFNAFLRHVATWQLQCKDELNDVVMDDDSGLEEDQLTTWLNAFRKNESPDEVRPQMTAEEIEEAFKEAKKEAEEKKASTQEAPKDDEKVELPQYVVMTKEIVEQVLRFVSSSEQSHQIHALECLISGVPLLKDYENELLPLVHAMWQPLVEKFRQKDPLVLNRCFSLISTLASYAKDFILKRSLDDIMPSLLKFLETSAPNSASQTITAHTQEYKLQLKLLQDFPTLIRSMQIEGKHLNDIAEVISPYLSEEQPQQLQDTAVDFYRQLSEYNGPLMYLVAVKKIHLPAYAANASKVMKAFGLADT